MSSTTGDLASPGTTVWNSLTPGNSYTANGYAVNANGESAASPSSNSATVGQAPTTISSSLPTFTASGNVVTLTSGTWNNSPTSYTYQIANGLTNWNNSVYVLNTTTTNTSVAYTGSYSTTYYSRVVATNAYGSNSYGDMTATTGAAPDLTPQNYSAPTLTAAAATGNAATSPYDRLTCTAGLWTNSPTSYTYYLYSSGGALIGSSSPTSATSFLFQDTMGYNIDYSTSYFARVIGANAYGSNLSNASNTATTAAYYVPPTPTGSISASNVTSTQCTATFSVSNAASWQIVGSYIGGAFYLSGTNASSPVTVTNLPSGANGVSIILNMYTGAGLTGTLYQASTTINVPPAASAPSTPTGLVNTYSSGPSWTGSWNASTGTTPITYYWELEQAASSGGTITAFASGSTSGTSFTQSMNPANGLWARFLVVASNSVGSSGTATSNWA